MAAGGPLQVRHRASRCRLAVRPVTIVGGIALALASAALLAHGDSGHVATPYDASQVEQMPFGRAGDPGAVTRTVTIGMSDAMRFTPEVVSVRRGDTVRFFVRNNGKALHELVIGTAEELAKHAELMRRFPTMKHDEPHMVHVAPGRTQALVWNFNRSGTFEFACLVAGHFEAGMKGRIVVE